MHPNHLLVLHGPSNGGGHRAKGAAEDYDPVGQLGPSAKKPRRAHEPLPKS